MTEQEKLDKINEIVMIGYYWLSEDNFHCAQNISELLKQIPMNTKQEKRIKELESDIKTMATSKKFDLSLIAPITLPESDPETKLLNVASLSIMNLFNAGNFEMGYTFLFEMAEDWPILYQRVVSMLQKFNFKKELIEWAITHFLFAKDIAGNDDFNVGGYKIIKSS